MNYRGYDDDEDDPLPVFTKNVSTSLSLPVKLLVKIDSIRGDVSRSKYIARILMEKLNVSVG
jgi:hypothetical protein